MDFFSPSEVSTYSSFWIVNEELRDEKMLIYNMSQ